MAHQINTLYKIHTGLYGSISTSHGLIGGYNSLKTSVSVGATTITTNIDNNNFYIYPELDKIKLTDGNNTDYLTVRTCTRSESPLQYVINTYQPLQNNYTSASTTVYLESYFGWSEFNASVSNQTYGSFLNYNIIDVPEIEKSVDLSVGGNVQNSTGGTLKVSNINRLSNYLNDNNIYLNGCRIDCLMSISNSYYQLGSYQITDTNYTSEEYNISFSHYDHNATITKKINKTEFQNATKDLIDISIPVVFGNNYQTDSWDGFTKFIRSADLKTDIYFEPDCSNWSDEIYFITPGLTEDIKCYPCVDASSTTVRRQYKFAIGSSYEGNYNVYSGATHLTSGTHILNQLYEKYAYVTQGQEKGEYRKIETSYIDLDYDSTGHTIVINFSDYFKNVLKSNETATEADNSFIKIINVSREYIGETWPCGGFLSSSGVSVSSNYEVFSYFENKTSKFDVSGAAESLSITINEKDKNFVQLPTTTFSVIDSELNSIKTSFRQCSNDLDSFDSFISKPLSDIYLTPLDNAGFFARYGIFEDFGTASNGIYYVGPIGDTSIGSNYSDIIDKNSNSYHDIIIHDKEQQFGDNSQIVISFDLIFPEIDFEFDNIYFGIKSRMISLFSSPPDDDNRTVLALCAKQFIGNRDEIYLLDTTQMITDITFYDILDEYFYPYTNTNNKYFYSSETSTTIHSGHETYDISSIFTNENYGTHKYISLWLWNVWHEHDAIDQEFEYMNYECCLIFKKKSSTKKQLYIPFSGRIYNDTWEERKQSSELIYNPVDTLEHVLRLQNRIDYDAVPVDTGLEYTNVPLIETNYIDNNLSDIKYQNAFSIQEYDKSNTEYLKKELCRQFGLLSFTGLNGYEKIYPYNGFEPSLKTFNLSNIVDRKIIKVTDPDSKDIYCEPFVKFNYNLAEEKYDGYIAINNVHKNIYNPSYVIGMTSDQETYWNLCHNAYLKYKTIQKPPDNYTILNLVNGNNAQYYAQLYFTNWIDSFSKKNYTFDVHISDCFGLNVGDYVTINFPHHTNGINKSGIITKIIYKLKNNYSNTITVRC